MSSSVEKMKSNIVSYNDGLVDRKGNLVLFFGSLAPFSDPPSTIFKNHATSGRVFETASVPRSHGADAGPQANSTTKTSPTLQPGQRAVCGEKFGALNLVYIVQRRSYLRAKKVLLRIGTPTVGPSRRSETRPNRPRLAVNVLASRTREFPSKR